MVMFNEELPHFNQKYSQITEENHQETLNGKWNYCNVFYTPYHISMTVVTHIVVRHCLILHAELSSIRDNGITIMSSQLPTANGKDGPSGSGPGTVIGVVVAVVIVLVVGSVIVAALLIAWTLRSRGKKGFAGKYSD